MVASWHSSISRYRVHGFVCGSVALLCLFVTGCASVGGGGSAAVSRSVPASSEAFEFLGVWQRDGANSVSAYAGSQIRFSLKGKATLLLRSGNPGSVRVCIRRDGKLIWDQPVVTPSVSIDGGLDSTTFSVVYVSSRGGHFDPLSPKVDCWLRFSGCELERGASLGPPVDPRTSPSVMFIGDSITSGGCLLGRGGSWRIISDVTQTYAFLLADKIRAKYQILAIPGGTTTSFLDVFSLESAPSEKPCLVVINFGANERTKHRDKYSQQMRNLVHSVLKCYPATHIVLLNFMRMTPNRLPALEDVASEFSDERVSVFDARPFLVNYSDKGIHPDVESHRRLCDALVPVVEQGICRMMKCRSGGK
jgi:hypothetical protein